MLTILRQKCPHCACYECRNVLIILQLKSPLQGLKEWGAHILIGQEGPLACGEDGFGRMAEIEDIKTQIINML